MEGRMPRSDHAPHDHGDQRLYLSFAHVAAAVMNQFIYDDVTETVPRSEYYPKPIGFTAILAALGI